ncbi:MAG: hypothetical protein JST28_01550 [Acidobacteria bacterium]|nr:hypothetical protein [Acidobacteriota bacterium]
MSPLSSQASSQRQLGRSILAVIAGMAAGIAITLVTDIVLRKAGVLPPLNERASDGVLALATAYRVAYGVAASYLTAYLAPYRPIAHAMVGGAFGFAASLAGAIATWNAGPAYGPHWYPIALIVFALPQSWLGGWLRARQPVD